jgi:hypothetical protein
MIVARVCKGGKTIVQTGSIRIKGYEEADDGWFPIESCDFGFQAKETAARGGTPDASGNKGGSNQSSSKSNDKGEKKDEKSQLHLNKSIDTATSSIMGLVMDQRSSKKGKDDDLSVDLHFLSSISFGKSDSGGGGPKIFTNLMIHLEGIHVRGWTLNCSGDSRPTENITMEFDKAAMVYVYTNGKTFLAHPPRGFNQTENKSWTGDGWEWSKYVPKP